MTRRTLFLLFDADLAVLLLRVNTLVQVARETLVVYFIVRYLTPDQQGIWYTFNSLAFFAVFAELGFAEMTSQRVSSGYAKLVLRDGRLSGEPYHLDSLVSYIRHALKTYVVIVAIVISLLTLVGYSFFGRDSFSVFVVFLCFALGKSGNLLATLLQSVYQGLDKIADVEGHTLRSSLAASAILLFSLALGFGLWALVLGECVNFTARVCLLYRAVPHFWRQLITHKAVHQFQWFKDRLPVQARYGINAVGGYMAHNLFVPVIYRIEGPAIAGQLGLTLAIMGAASRLSTAWIKSKVPTFSILVANGRRDDLNTLLRASAIRTYTAYALASVGLLTVVYVMHLFAFYSDRFLSVPMVAAVLLFYAVIMIITPWNMYLRAHGDEPWYIVSVVHGSLVALALLTVVPQYGLLGLVISINIIHWFILLPFGATVFSRFRARYESLSSVPRVVKATGPHGVQAVS